MKTLILLVVFLMMVPAAEACMMLRNPELVKSVLIGENYKYGGEATQEIVAISPPEAPTTSTYIVTRLESGSVTAWSLIEMTATCEAGQQRPLFIRYSEVKREIRRLGLEYVR